MFTVQELLYPSLILILAIFLIVTVPRAILRALLPYGVVLGGLLDFLYNLLFGGLFKIFTFENPGIFHASGHLLLAPLAWTLLVVFYLYFWPKDNMNLGYLYGVAWALLATGFSQVVYQAELFKYKPWFYPLPMFLTFAAKFALTTWVAKPWRADW